MRSPAGAAATLVLALLSLLLGAAGCSRGGRAPEAVGELDSDRRLTAVSFDRVRIVDDFWSPRLERNRRVTLPHLFEQNRRTGRVANFERAAGLAEGAYEGRRFNDTDVYKAIEAAAYELARERDPRLEGEVDALIELVAAAQTDDGYLFPAHSIDPENPAPGVGKERWVHVAAGSHELYNAGHLIEAAVAHHAATGKRSLLEVAIRFADLIDREFGPDARRDIPGHQEIELALVKLADHLDEPRYLELARFFLDQRGGEHDGEGYPEDTDFAIYNDRPYKQDHLPVADQREATGHAVRAAYLYIAMADVAARRDVPEYERALAAIHRDVVAHKMYLTGGIGSRGTFESFGDRYELPNASAYAESCAAIGHELWNHRMFLASGDPRFLDVMERALYNNVLAGISQQGDRFFYTNPLASPGGVERSAYFDVACCPANLARALAQLPGFVYARRDGEIWVTLYVGSETTLEVPAGGAEPVPVRIVQQTGYPWDGRIELAVEPERAVDLTLVLRIPGWARGEPVPSDLYRFAEPAPPGDAVAAVLVVAGEERRVSAEEAGAGVLRVERRFVPGAGAANRVRLELPMPVRRVLAHPEVEADRGRVALQRGPLVYAFEEADNGSGIDARTVPGDAALRARPSPDLLGGVVAIEVEPAGANARPLVAVPYFAWANRGAGEMAVWMQRDEADGDEADGDEADGAEP